MEAKVWALIFVYLANLCNSLKLPASFKKCDKRESNFNECLSSAILHAVKNLDQSFPKYGLPTMDPFKIPANLESGNSTDGIRQVYSDIQATGYTKVTDVHARFDFDTKVLNLNLTFPEILLEADVRIYGNLIVLPVDNSGTASFLFKKPTFEITFYLEEYEKEDTRYYKVTYANFNIESEKIVIDFKAIFDNENLNEALNAEFNANERKVFEYLRKTYDGGFGQVYGAVFNNLLAKVPAADLFDGVNV